MNFFATSRFTLLKLITTSGFAIYYFLNFSALAFSPKRMSCSDTIPKAFRVDPLKSARDYTVYNAELSKAYAENRILFESLMKLHVTNYANLSGSRIEFPVSSKVIYRSSMLAFSPHVINELVNTRNVQSILHLSNSKMVDQEYWTSSEKVAFHKSGGNLDNYVHILGFDYNYKRESELQEVRSKVAEIIRKIEMMPGNVLIHCLGGEHRTELVFEVLQKCYNKIPMSNILKRYLCHTGSPNGEQKSNGYKQENIDFIKFFPCEILKLQNLKTLSSDE